MWSPSPPAGFAVRPILSHPGAEKPPGRRDLLDAVEQEVGSLSGMPERFPLVRDEALRREGIRFFPIKHYLLFYTVRRETNTVVIQRFLYGRRNWADLLRPEED